MKAVDAQAEWGERQQQVARAIAAASVGREGLFVTELEIANRLAPEDSRSPWWMWPTLRDMEEQRMVVRAERGGAVEFALTTRGDWIASCPLPSSADFPGAYHELVRAMADLGDALLNRKEGR